MLPRPGAWALSDDGRVLVVRAASGLVSAYDPSVGRATWSFDGAWTAVTASAAWIVGGGAAGMQLWRALDGGLARNVPVADVRAVDLTPDGAHVGALSGAGEVVVARTLTGRVVARWPAPQDARTLVLRADGGGGWVAGSNGLWEVGPAPQLVEAGVWGLTGVSLTRGGRAWVAWGASGWRCGGVAGERSGAESVQAALLDRNGELLRVAADGSLVDVAHTREHPGDGRWLAHPDGRHLLCWTEGAVVAVER